MTRLLTAILYLLLLWQRAVDSLRGRDRLRRAEPHSPSLWIDRSQPGSDVGYFQEWSPVEPQKASVAERALIAIARRFAPARLQPREKFSAAADREQGIPDEMYTLW